MDYKYIEQLLERYWEAETSPEEESILRAFFAQDEVPEAFAPYKALFDYTRQAAEEVPGREFDERVTKMARKLENEHPVAGKHTLMFRLRPFMHAAAILAVVVTIGTTASRFLQSGKDQPLWDYSAEAYKDTYDTPEEAYEILDDGFRELRDVMRDATAEVAVSPDSATVSPVMEPSKEER